MYKDEHSGKNRNVIMLPRRNIITENIVVVSLSLELYYFNLELGNCLFGSVIGTTFNLSNSKQPAVSRLQLIRFLSFTICYWFTNHNILRTLLIRSDSSRQIISRKNPLTEDNVVIETSTRLKPRVVRDRFQLRKTTKTHNDYLNLV